MRPCVLPPRVEALFPPALWSSCHQATLAFKARRSGGSSSRCQTPRLLSWCGTQEFSLLWEHFCDMFVLQFVNHPPWEVWDLIISWTHSSYHLVWHFFMSLDVECPVFFINGCSAVSCDLGGLVSGGELMVLLLLPSPLCYKWELLILLILVWTGFSATCNQENKTQSNPCSGAFLQLFKIMDLRKRLSRPTTLPILPWSQFGNVQSWTFLSGTGESTS